MCRSCATSGPDVPYIATFPSVTIPNEEFTVKKVRKLLHDARCVLPDKQGFGPVALDVSDDRGCRYVSEFWTDAQIEERFKGCGDITLFGCFRIWNGGLR